MPDFWFHPALILIIGSILLPVIPTATRKTWLILIPTLVFGRILYLEQGIFGEVGFLNWTLTFGRVDKLSLVFAHIMALMALIGSLYALHVKNTAEHMCAWLYVAGSLGVIFSGDLLTLFVFWELMAFSSVFLIWFRKTDKSLAAGFRYLLVHTTGGLVLLAGIILLYNQTGGNLTFGDLTSQSGLAANLILIGFIINAAVPPLHAWLPDAYTEGTFSGSVFLSAFTTKTAVYALCRGFAGADILIILGVIMALYGVVYAILENDCRRLLSYHIVSQVGYMVAAVGIGTEMAINGACAHAFAHILYKGLLFMGCGSVLHMTGKSKFTELGGLYKKMPWAFVFTLVGGLSISAFPLFSGFVSKSIVVAASFEDHKLWAGFLLLVASTGTFFSVGLKIPYLIWFSKNRCSKETWERAKDPPWNMNAAMAITSILCVFIGCYTPYLYNLLPFEVTYHPYNSYHLWETLQILCFTALGFYLVLGKLKPHATYSIDLDWPYRKLGRGFLWIAEKPVQGMDGWVDNLYRKIGLVPLMAISRISSWFDGFVIDGVVDGLALGVRQTGQRLRKAQRGHLQHNLALTFVIAGILLITFIFLP